MDLEAVNRTLAATVRKQEEEIKAANAEITRLRHNIRAEAFDMLHGTPCAEIRWQQERETLVADNERLRAALERAAVYFDTLNKPAYALITRTALGGSND